MAKKEKQKKALINYNLENKTVAIVAGDLIRHQSYIKLIKAHHGKPKMIDAFYHHKKAYKYYSSKLHKANLIIMIQNYTKHNTSYAIAQVIKKTNQSFAVANSAGLQAVDRAIYRALNNLPAYDNVNGNVVYPTKTHD